MPQESESTSSLSASSSKSKKGHKEKRGKWDSDLEFLLATVGLTVGLGNVWRFPALAYNNGGSAFLIPYLTCAVFFGLPMLYLEMAVAQYTNSGPSMIFRHYLPALQGLGWSSVLISVTVAIYYCVIIAWSSIYFFYSLTGMVYYWSRCDNAWNDIYCTDEEKMLECRKKDVKYPIAFNGTCIATPLDEMKTPFDQFFTNVVTKRSEGIEDFGAVNRTTLVALFILWATVMLILVKGHKYMGKVAYFTSTAPYIIILILFLRGITLDGALEGVQYFLGSPDFEKLFRHETWIAALVQVCFSLDVGHGGLIMLASYNHRFNDCYRDAWIVISGVFIMSVFGGVAVFATLGYLSYQTRKPIEEVVSSGLSLAFVAYPEAMSMMPYPPIWSCFFFAMLFCLGISSEVAFVETICTSVYDQWPQTRKFKWLTSLCCCTLLFLGGLVMTFESSYFWFSIFDGFCAYIGACVVITLEALIFMYMYGSDNIEEDLTEMLGETEGRFLYYLGPHSPVWRLCWSIATPAIGVLIFVLTVLREELVVTHRSKPYHFPKWALAFGWFLSIAPLAAIPVFFIHNAIQWKLEGKPLRTLFTIQPSLVSFKRIMGLSSHGIRPSPLVHLSVEPSSDSVKPSSSVTITMRSSTTETS